MILDLDFGLDNKSIFFFFRHINEFIRIQYLVVILVLIMITIELHSAKATLVVFEHDVLEYTFFMEGVMTGKNCHPFI